MSKTLPYERQSLQDKIKALKIGQSFIAEFENNADRIVAHDRAKKIGYKISTDKVFDTKNEYHVKRIE